MSQDSVSGGIQEVQEIILRRGNYAMSVTANKQEQIETLAHGLKLTPFIDYKISNDGGSTFWPPTNFQTIDPQILVEAFTDNNYVYFSYHYSGTPANPALSLVFQYKLFITEATR